MDARLFDYLSLSIGILFAIAGILGLIEFILAPRGYRYELGLVAFGIIGGSLIHDALKERYFLEVHNQKDTRKLVLSKHARENEIQEFCKKVRTIYQYEITDAA